jgi:NAD(P)-dependent dehydrogenase (short-subunit alcohol dehydrogenase family)
LPRTVLVTGSAKRLGRDMALALAHAGWRVAVHYRHSADDAVNTVEECDLLTADHGVLNAAFGADLSNEADVKALVPRVIERFGYLDAVVNSASTFEQDDVSSFGFEGFQKHLLGNTAAPILLAQALHRHWCDAQRTRQHLAQAPQYGVVINMLDQKLWNPNPDFLSYTLSKAALEAANTLLAQALAPQLRVVGVAPGLTITSHMLDDHRFQDLHKLSPLGRSSTPEDVVATVKFALENQSLTGTTLLVDGGQHLLRFDRDFSLM